MEAVIQILLKASNLNGRVDMDAVTRERVHAWLAHDFEVAGFFMEEIFPRLLRGEALEVLRSILLSGFSAVASRRLGWLCVQAAIKQSIRLRGGGDGASALWAVAWERSRRGVRGTRLMSRIASEGRVVRGLGYDEFLSIAEAEGNAVVLRGVAARRWQ